MCVCVPLPKVSADIFRLANTNGDHHLSYEEFSEFAKQAAVNSGNEEPDEEEVPTHPVFFFGYPPSVKVVVVPRGVQCRTV